jgi:hypothetical protein
MTAKNRMAVSEVAQRLGIGRLAVCCIRDAGAGHNPRYSPRTKVDWVGADMRHGLSNDCVNSCAGIRLIGLISSAVAVVGIGLTVLACNQNLGRNQTITHSQQIFLLVAAAGLFAVQAVLYLIFRHRHKRTIARPGRGPNEDM